MGPPSEVYKDLKPGEIPWGGLCGTGKGKDTYTAGFEGPWTTEPLKWDNEFYKNMLTHQWEKFVGPGGKWQWRIKNPSSTGEANLMRLTSDMALIEDDRYLPIVKEFAANMTAFDEAFDVAWTKLITKGGTWSRYSKCDDGSFPEQMLGSHGMLPNDVMV